MTESLLSGVLPALVTVIVLSRIVADNPLVRFLQYLFVGMTLGLAVLVILHYVIGPIVSSMAGDSRSPATIWLPIGAAVLAALLQLRRFRHGLPRLLASLPLAVVVGTTAAVMRVGVVLGTLATQVRAAITVPSADPAVIAGAIVAAVVTVLTMHLLGRTPADQPQRRPSLLERASRGIVLTVYGVVLAAAVSGYLTALQERLTALVDWLRRLLPA